ncbi:MAG: amidohydrolase family protein [Cocleimonas sp.]
MTNILFQNSTVFDGHNADIKADQFVWVSGSKICYVGNNNPGGKFDQIIDLKGKIIMPGLIDAHFHAYASTVDFPALETLPKSYIAHHAARLLAGALDRGFTTVRDVGGADYGLWRASEEGLIKSPRIFYCGRAFSQTGGHADVRPIHMEPCSCSNLNGNLGVVVDGVDNLRKAVRESLRQGAHHIKVMVSGGIASPSDPIWMMQYSMEELEAAVDEASRKRAYVAAHAYTAETIERAVMAGIRTIEHGNLINTRVAEIVAKQEAYVVPTLITYDAFARFGKEAKTPQHLLDKLDDVRLKGQEAVEICAKANVKLGFGTDLLGEMHSLQLEEFRLRGEVQSPFEVLKSAASINAEIVGRTGELGCIQKNAYADILIIDGNPLEDLSLLYANKSKINAIMKNGKWVRRLSN